MQKMKRSELTAYLRDKADVLALEAFFITSVRPVKDGQLQVEVCQNRVIGQRTVSLLSILNQSDDRFSNPATLLFDWITFKPEDFLAAIPNSGWTLEELQEIADSWNSSLPTGTNADVYVKFTEVPHITFGGQQLTPVITVTEVTETAIKNGEFFTESGANQAAQIAAAIEDENNVMKTSADGEYIVAPNGDKVFRYTRTNFKEQGATDTLIQGKMSQTRYKQALKNKVNTSERVNPSDLQFEMESSKQAGLSS